MEAHWMIPIVAFALVPTMLLVVAIAASILVGAWDWLEERMCGKCEKCNRSR